MFGPMFTTVGSQTTEGTGSYNIQNLIPTGSLVPNGETTAGAIRAQKLTSTGATDGSVLFWRDGTFGSGSRARTYKGWYTASGTTPATMEITTGQALWINLPSGAACSFTISGEVPVGDIYMALNSGNTAVCNPQPVSMSLQTVVPAAAEGYTVPNGEATASAIRVQKLTATGATDGSIVFWRNGTFGSGSRARTYLGWYTASGTSPAAVTLDPGEGIWVNSPVEGVSLVFPSAL